MQRPIAVLTSILLLVGAGTSLPAQQEPLPRIDVVFLLDATGSMGDEIAVIKEKMREMISAIALGEPSPDVRFGIVAYRDRGDEYVTRRPGRPSRPGACPIYFRKYQGSGLAGAGCRSQSLRGVC